MRKAGLAFGAVVLGATVIWIAAASARTLAAPIKFSAPKHLPDGTAGQPYSYSFCKPQPKAGGRCGKPAGATNPSGGYGQYYIFTLKLSVAPPGLRFSTRSGLLSGTPTKIGISKFTVCASDADTRRPGVAPRPACGATDMDVAEPPVTNANFGGSWSNGSFQTTSVDPNSCGSEAHGSAQFSFTQNGTSVTGTMSYQVTGATPHANPAANCEALQLSGSIPVNATVSGQTLTGSGWTLTQSSPNALTGTFSGSVQGFQLTLRVTANR